MVIIVGILCTIYFALYFMHDAHDKKLVAQIFPPMPAYYYVVLGMMVGFYQGMTWKTFDLFSGNWYKHMGSWLLFFSEFATMMFAACLISWPVFFIYTFFIFLFKMN